VLFVDINCPVLAIFRGKYALWKRCDLDSQVPAVDYRPDEFIRVP
jgi:hypothetical protein